MPKRKGTAQKIPKHCIKVNATEYQTKQNCFLSLSLYMFFLVVFSVCIQRFPQQREKNSHPTGEFLKKEPKIALAMDPRLRTTTKNK